MKKLLTLLVILVMGLAAMAQSPVPAKLNYQAVVRSGDNHLASEQTVNVAIEVKENGTSKFSETHLNVHTNINGLLNLVVGEGTSQSGSLTDVDWTNNVHIFATITWGSNSVQTDNPVYSVPVALQASTATNTVSSDGTVLVPAAGDSSEIVNVASMVYYVGAAIHDSIVNNISDQIRDSIAANALDCSDIADCLVSEIQNNNTDLIKTIDSVTYLNTLDSIQKATSELNHAIDTIVGNTIHDSIVNNIANQIHDSIASIATTTLGCDDVAACILSNEDAKENIIKIVSDTLANGNSKLNHIVDTIAGASQVNADWNATSGKAKILNKPTTISGYGITDASINTATRVITLGTNTITVPEIPTNNTTADNLCDQIAAAECPSIAYLTKDNAFTGKNTFSDNTTFSDTVVVPNVIESDSTFAAGDATQAVNALDVQKYVTKAVVTLEKQTSYKVASATANQTAFALTIPAGYTAVNSDTRLVQLYINGVYVGDNVDGVVTVSGTTVTYVPANNDSYALVAGDRIQIVYWVKK